MSSRKLLSRIIAALATPELLVLYWWQLENMSMISVKTSPKSIHDRAVRRKLDLEDSRKM